MKRVIMSVALVFVLGLGVLQLFLGESEEPPTAADALPLSESLVRMTCQNELRARTDGRARFTSDFVEPSESEGFHVYAARVFYAKDALPAEEDWVCRYYDDGRIEIERVLGF